MSQQQKSKNEALLYAELLCIIKDIFTDNAQLPL